MPAVMDDAIRITPDNVEVYRALHGRLRAQLEELVALTRKYPVEIEFRGLRFVFDNEAHLLDAIRLMGERLNHYAA